MAAFASTSSLTPKVLKGPGFDTLGLKPHALSCCLAFAVGTDVATPNSSRKLWLLVTVSVDMFSGVPEAVPNNHVAFPA